MPAKEKENRENDKKEKVNTENDGIEIKKESRDKSK